MLFELCPLSLRLACIADSTRRAREAYRELAAKYTFVDITQKHDPASGKDANTIVVLGGDGFMLQSMHQYMAYNLPFYGMNCGTVGFLMNSYSSDDLVHRIEEARRHTLHPLSMYARDVHGKTFELLAINEVSLFRQGRQAAKIRAKKASRFLDHVVRWLTG